MTLNDKIHSLDLHGLDPVEAILELTCKRTFLPDSNLMFGSDVAFGLIERFGGKTIRMPAPKDLEKALIDFQIWSAISERRAHNHDLLIPRLMKRYDLTKAEVNQAFDRVERVLGKIDPMKVIFAHGKSHDFGRIELAGTRRQ